MRKACRGQRQGGGDCVLGRQGRRGRGGEEGKRGCAAGWRHHRVAEARVPRSNSVPCAAAGSRRFASASCGNHSRLGPLLPYGSGLVHGGLRRL